MAADSSVPGLAPGGLGLAAPGVVFTRDRFTRTAYLLAGYFTYLQATLGPLMPFLRDELGFGYTTAGMHFSAFALGMIGNGLTADRMMRRFGRGRVLRGGGAGMAAGAVLLSLGDTVAFTVASTLCMGYLGSLLGTVVQASLADLHGERRVVALTECNVVASVCATLAPLSVGLWQGTGFGWRGALWLGVLAAVLLGLHLSTLPVPGRDRAEARAARDRYRLPPRFWAYWGIMILCVSAEWCMIFWGAAFLQEAAGMTKVAAATTMSLYLGAMVAGRVAGSRLARRIRADRLLVGAAGLAALGFPLFWLGPTPGLHVAGLVLVGLGIANLYPLVVSEALGVASADPAAGSARLGVAIGLAIFSAPLLLGWLADRLDVRDAYGVVAVLLVLALAAVRGMRRRG